MINRAVKLDDASRHRREAEGLRAEVSHLDG
jgi:hypothetical protein